MASRFHIHPVTGTPAICKAVQGRCPFGAAHEHYPSKDEARKAFEAQMEADAHALSSYTPEVAAAVRELLDYHVANTDDVDVKALLLHTRDELATASSVTKLNRTIALYRSAANDLLANSDENAFEASSAVAQIAEYLQEYYYISRISDAEETAYRFDELSGKLQQLKQLNMNRAAVGAGEGEVVTDGHQVLLTSNTTVGEILRTSPGGSVYPGRAREEQLGKAQAEIEARASEIVSALSKAGAYTPPKQGAEGGASLPEGFAYLSSGAEVNVYLHEATATVYKIPHEDSQSIYYMRSADLKTPTGKRYALNSVVADAADAYDSIDRKALNEKLGAEYLPTYFLSTKDQEGSPVGVIVQPYLDDSRYTYYHPTPDESDFEFDGNAGVYDLHSGNMRLDKKTGKLVLFDCLFDFER